MWGRSKHTSEERMGKKNIKYEETKGKTNKRKKEKKKRREGKRRSKTVTVFRVKNHLSVMWGTKFNERGSSATCIAVFQ